MESYTDMIHYAERRITRDCDMDDVELKTVWVGDQHFSYCWSLPDRFLKKNRTVLEEVQLKKFKRLAGICMDEPRTYADSEGMEPALRGMLRSIPRLAYPLTEMACGEGFESGAITVDSLVESYMKENPDLVENLKTD